MRQSLIQKIEIKQSSKMARNGHLSTESNHSSSSAGASSDSAQATISCWDPPFVRIKVEVVLARCVELGFPQNWPAAFSDLQQESQFAPDIFLRTLIALTDDFGHEESEVTTRVKDILRGFASGGSKPMSPDDVSVTTPADPSISSQILSTVISILSQSIEHVTGSSGPAAGQSSQAFYLYILCLTSIKGFPSWVDLNLLIQEQVLRLAFAALRQGSTADSPTADGGVLVMEFLEELVVRGMEYERKIALLKHMNIFTIIHENINLETVDASPIDVVMEVAKFLNRTGAELIGMAKSSTSSNDFATLWSQLQ